MMSCPLRGNIEKTSKTANLESDDITSIKNKENG